MHCNVTKEVYIDDNNDELYVANAFGNYFNGVYSNSSSVHEAVNDYNAALQFTQHDSLDMNNINVEHTDAAIHKLKLGKAAGTDGLSSEHLLYAHPIHLSLLFYKMLNHCFVPHDFGVGSIVPIIRDKIFNSFS